MKELSTEEKARRYDEAIKYANYLINERCKEGTDGSFHRADLNKMFPELKELKDERIRKELISYIKQINYDDSHAWNGINLNVFIDWLEKWGEQIPNYCHHEVDLSECSEEYRKAYYDGWNNCNQQHSQLEAEQKPADKVEPKFKVGDWITNGIDFTFQVCSIKDNMYLRNDHYFIDIETADKTFRLWTIQDAKDGDILVCGERKGPFIFKGLLDKSHPESPVAYCGIDTLDNFIIASGRSWWTDEEVYPATKEQHKLLFQRIEEAGWEWDAYKKELKLIEPFN